MADEYFVMDDTNYDLDLSNAPYVPKEIEEELIAKCNKRMDEFLAKKAPKRKQNVQEQ